MSRARTLASLLVAVTCFAAASPAPAGEVRPPPGFPAPLVPADNPLTPAKVRLGERLFFEPRLSSSGRHPCASCHLPERAFTDGRTVPRGARGDALRRNAMALGNVAWNAGFNWASPELTRLEEQLLRPLLGEHPVEMGLKGREAAVLEALSGDASLSTAFAEAFPGDGAPVTWDNLVRALAAYVRSLVSAESPFDRYLFRDDRQALDEPARRGMALFFSERTGCADCHSGILFGGPVRSVETPDARPLYANTGLYDVDGRGGYPPGDQGLKEATGREEDNGRFRVPSLRDVALTAPYMHDGSLATLAEVIDHYDRGGRARQPGRAAPLRDPRIRPLGLDAQEKLDLEAFLRSLTGTTLPVRAP